MKKLFLAGAAFAALSCGARGDTILDPLHGLCSAGCVENLAQTPTPTSAARQLATGFGLAAIPSTTTGDLTLVFLVPVSPLNQSFVPAVNELLGPDDPGNPSGGTALAGVTFKGTFGPGPSSLTLEGFLGINATPSNPIGGFTSPDIADIPGFSVTAFYVFTVDAGIFTTGLSGESVDEFKTTDILPLGTAVVGYLSNSDGTFGTANSGQLEVTSLAAAPVPGPIVGAGLPGLVAGCFTLLGLAEHRRRRRGLVA
jgi:hypothetical protein